MTKAAQEIFEKFLPFTGLDNERNNTIKCAIVAVEMFYESTRSIDCDPPGFPISKSHREYWLPILTELKNEL